MVPVLRQLGPTTFSCRDWTVSLGFTSTRSNPSLPKRNAATLSGDRFSWWAG